MNYTFPKSPRWIRAEALKRAADRVKEMTGYVSNPADPNSMVTDEKGEWLPRQHVLDLLNHIAEWG